MGNISFICVVSKATRGSRHRCEHTRWWHVRISSPAVLPRYGQPGGSPDADLSDRVGHSFSGMIVTDVGVDPKVTALVYVAARAPDAGEDYAACTTINHRQALPVAKQCIR